MEGAASHKELLEEWDNLQSSKKEQFGKKAEELQSRVPHLLDAIYAVLKRTNATLSWRSLANEVAGEGIKLVCAETIRKFCMSQAGSQYRATRILPKIDASCKQRRFDWSKAFWCFWEEAKSLNDAVIVLVHMDEKWFFALVARTKR
jgi:hypothetical protein